MTWLHWWQQVRCLAPLLTTKLKHEESMLWAKFVGLTELAGVGLSIVKVLGPVCMVAIWVVAWPRLLAPLLLVDPLGCCRQLPCGGTTLPLSEY
jgi:hypothetical protein